MVIYYHKKFSINLNLIKFPRRLNYVIGKQTKNNLIYQIMLRIYIYIISNDLKLGIFLFYIFFVFTINVYNIT